MDPSRPRPVLRAHCTLRSTSVVARQRLGSHRGARTADDRGEGVVSAAIVVLIMAGLGALMWVGFRTMWTDIESDTNDRISEVGS
jgi:hypothetical protein